MKEPKTEEEEALNCQAVIDSLSMDILNVSLSHITGEDIVKGDRRTIADLLDVFAGLLEYILDRIASDVSSDNGKVHIVTSTIVLLLTVSVVWQYSGPHPFLANCHYEFELHSRHSRHFTLGTV